MKYARLWVRLALMSFWVQASSPLSSFGYLLGKLMRLLFFFVFLVAIFRHTDAIVGYTFEEAALFFLTFNLVDTLAQLLFRGIYGIRGLIREGEYDYYLIQPVNILYRISFNTIDFLDVLTVIPVFGMTVVMLHRIPHAWSFMHLFVFAALVLNGLVIAFALHVVVASLAVWTQEMENTIWIYRDLMTLGRFPSDIYGSAMQRILTFVIPIAVMVSFPPKAYLGRLNSSWLAVAFLMAGVSFMLSLAFWSFANRRYTSSSS